MLDDKTREPGWTTWAGEKLLAKGEHEPMMAMGVRAVKDEAIPPAWSALPG